MALYNLTILVYNRQMIKKKIPKYVVVKIGDAQALLMYCINCATQYFRTKEQVKAQSSCDFCGVCNKKTVLKPVDNKKVIKF